MLVLVSFGLVLLATILLVVGLLTDDGLTLIYVSIAASATAAVVLYLAFRKAKPSGEPASTAPAPLSDELTPAPLPDEPAAVAAPASAVAPPSAAPAPVAPAAAAADDSEWDAGDHWSDEDESEQETGSEAPAAVAEDEGEDLEFPIADYDDLKVGEIMPLLPQLYSDELPMVVERERAGKNRSTILARLEELARTGTEADAVEAQAEVAVAPEPPVAPAPAPEPTSVQPAVDLGVDDDDDWDGEYFFPIADYDELTVGQIMPLLPQLELDELAEVKEREVAGQARKSLIIEIDRYLDGELEVGEVPTAPAAPAGRPSPAGATLPIAGYDDLTVAEIRPQLTSLDADELATILEHEVARDNRKTIVADIERRLDSEPAAPAPAEKAPARRTPKKAVTRKRAAAKATATKATSKQAASKKATKKRAKKAAKKATRTRFPIAKYDELTVAEIRPRLQDLSDNQLQQVRERELTGAGRKTILNDIENRLS